MPFDIGSFRKIKERAEGAKQTTFCIDVVFNPFIIQLFMEDDFCSKLENFRPFLINLAVNRIEESIGVRLATDDKIKLVKSLRYKDGEGDSGRVPREFADLPGNADCFDAEVSFPQSRTIREPEPLIQDITPGQQRRTAMKKGFLTRKDADLYGPGGSGEGVLPENAGDPLGYLPKGLRKSCKIVDCNGPEYQANEKQRKAVDEHNAMAGEFNKELSGDMQRWVKAAEREKWEEDLPEGTDPASSMRKYDNDYSRFDRMPDVQEPAPAVEERDWYFDSTGQRCRLEKPATSSTSSSATGSAAAAAPSAAGGPEELAIKKGFLGDAKKPLYPKGSEQAAPPSDDVVMKELLREAAAADRKEAAGTLAEERQARVSVKVPENVVPTFELTEVVDGLELAVAVPGLDSMRDVSLDVTERMASLAFPARTRLKPLQVEFPIAVVPTKVRAKFSKKTHHINISLPVAAQSA